MTGVAERKVEWFSAVNRPAIAVFTFATLLFVGLLIYAVGHIDSATQSYEAAKARALLAESQTVKHLDELDLLAEHEQAFNEWQRVGKIGPVDDMARVEMLLEISALIDARRFRYEIIENQPAGTLYGSAAEHVAFSQSDIRLEFEADHGGSVFQFFNEVRTKASGTYAVRDFKLERIEVDLPNRRSVNRLSTVVNATTEMSDTSGAVPTGRSTPQSDYAGIKVHATLSWLVIEPTSGQLN